MSTNASTHTPGPDLLSERSLGGIAVHFLALVFGGVICAGLVYLLANHEYTRENARNALNWHLSLLVLFVSVLLAAGLGAAVIAVLGDFFGTSALSTLGDVSFAIFGFGLVLGPMVALVVSALLGTVATIKAIFGTAWSYPGAYEFVEQGQTPSLGDAADPTAASNRWRALVAYAGLVPAVVGYGAWVVTTEPGDGWGILLVAGILAVYVFSLVAWVALYSDATSQASAADWTPTWWLYAGAPPVAGLVVYLVRRAMGSIYPPGDGIYGAFVALWVAVVVYLLQRRRHRRGS